MNGTRRCDLLEQSSRGRPESYVLFYHSDQRPDNASYYKGKLFEECSRHSWDGSATTRAFREAQQSEYDVNGKSRLTGACLIGEQKRTLKRLVTDFSSFVGKLIPSDKDPSLVGLIRQVHFPLKPQLFSFVGATAINPKS